MFDLFWRSVAIGIGGTVLMDIWALFLYLVAGQSKPNWGPVGRWFWHLRTGKVFHDTIAKAEPYAHEQALGWISHYAVGIAYGILLVAFTGPAWLAAPTFLPAWIVGIVTIGAGWFLLQPGPRPRLGRLPSCRMPIWCASSTSSRIRSLPPACTARRCSWA